MNMKISIFGKLIGMVVMAIVLTSATLFLTTDHYVTQGFDEKSLEELTGFKNAVDAEIEDMEILLTTVGSLMARNSEVAQSIFNLKFHVFFAAGADKFHRPSQRRELKPKNSMISACQ